jgi:hypothetical protein
VESPCRDGGGMCAQDEAEGLVFFPGVAVWLCQYGESKQNREMTYILLNRKRRLGAPS